MLAYECGDVRDGEATVQGKQAKIVSPTQERAILGYLETTRYPHRDRVMFLLSMKAGLRAKEMAALTWAMVTDAAGQIAEAIHLQNRASKGTTGGRTIPMHPDLQDALASGLAVAGLPKVIEMLKDGEGEPIWNISDAIDAVLRKQKAA